MIGAIEEELGLFICRDRVFGHGDGATCPEMMPLIHGYGELG